MKQINDFINEKLKLNNNSKLVKVNNFSNNYIICIPYDTDFQFLCDNYSEYIIDDIRGFTSFLFTKKKMIEIYEKLPTQKLEGNHGTSFVNIFIIPENIKSKKELSKINSYYIDFETDEENRWQMITNIKQLEDETD